MSLVAVAAAVMCSPGGHTSRTVAHSSPLSLAEKVVLPLHGEHWRSTLAVPSAAMPSPTPHVLHVTAVFWPSAVVKVPGKTGEHSRFWVVWTGAVVMRSPDLQTVKAVHVLPVR